MRILGRFLVSLPLLVGLSTCVSMAQVQLGPQWQDTPQERFFESPIVAKYACTACHTVGNRGGTVGPVLNNVGYRRDGAWLRSWLNDPNAVKNGTPMPKFPFSPDELDQAVEYLSAMKLPMRTEAILAEPVGAAEKGEKLFADFDCLACHRVGDTGRFIGPNLSWVGRRKSRDWETTWLHDPPAFKPGTFMPNFRLSDEAIQALTTYLHTLQGEKNEEGRQWERTSAEFFEFTRAEQGKQVFKRLACATCHGERLREGVPNPNAAPDERVPAIFKQVGALTLSSLKKRVERGGTPEKLRAAGPEPLYRCPPYRGALDEPDAENLLAYLKTLAPKSRRWKFHL